RPLMSRSSHDELASLKSPRSPLARRSNDSEDSLRALEMSDGPQASSHGRHARSYSVTGFEFQHDLLPLTASLSEPESLLGERGDKNINLGGGMSFACVKDWIQVDLEDSYCSCGGVAGFSC